MYRSRSKPCVTAACFVSAEEEWIADSREWRVDRTFGSYPRCRLPRLTYLEAVSFYLAAEVTRPNRVDLQENPPPHVGGYAQK
jgi:hypothetical protein